ncbi:MAG: signal peptidase I [Planctomycetota bacterium]
MSEDQPTNPEAKETAAPDKPEEKPGLWKGWVRPLLTVILIVTALRSSLIDWNDVPTGSMIPTIREGDRIVVNKLAYGFNLPFNGPVVSVPFVPIAPFANPLDFLPGFYYAEPKRNDIVTFWKPGGFFEHHEQALRAAGATADYAQDRATITDGGIRMVKRIVAGPGDTVELRPAVEKFDGRDFRFSKLILNGEEATYTRHGPLTLLEEVAGESRLVQYRRNDAAFINQSRGRLDPLTVSFGPYEVPEDQYLMIGDNRDNSADGRFFLGVPRDQITGKAKFVAVSFKGSVFKPNWSRFFKGFAAKPD